MSFQRAVTDLCYELPLHNLFPGIPLFDGSDNICLISVALPDGTYLLTFSTVL